MSLLKWLLGAGVEEGEDAPVGIDFDGVNDFFDGQSFVGSHLTFDVYYVSGTMPFGLTATTANTWISVDLTGTYTVEDIGLNFKGRLANLKLDTSVDMPFNNPSTAFVNNGTGGNFVQHGVVDSSQRGPNQWNCASSEFNSTTNLSSADIGTVSNLFVTAYFNFKIPVTASSWNVFRSYTDSDNSFLIIVTDGNVSIRIERAGVIGQCIFDIATEERLTTFSFSLDIATFANSTFLINGESAEPSYNDLNTLSTNLSSGSYTIASGLPGTMDIGEVYIDDTIQDPSIFWDSETNRPKPVLQVIEETGHTPLIAMPIRADDPEKNYGTGGDFTLNGGPLVGARGASEYPARSAGQEGGGIQSNYLEMSTSGLPSSFNTFSLCLFAANIDITASTDVILFSIGNQYNFVLYSDSSEDLKFDIGGSGNLILATDLWLTTGWKFLFLSYDGVSIVATTDVGQTVLPFTGFIDSGNNRASISGSSVTVTSSISYDWKGPVSSVYFTTDYINFSDENNRLKFVDGLGSPIDITKGIEAGEIPEPLIYMPFTDPDNLGYNAGTGGDFTVNGIVEQGADVNA